MKANDSKHALSSKTTWGQIILTALVALIPAVRDWVAQNPTEAFALAGAINLGLRRLTNSPIHFIPKGAPIASRLPILVLFLPAVLALSSCAILDSVSNENEFTIRKKGRIVEVDYTDSSGKEFLARYAIGGREVEVFFKDSSGREWRAEYGDDGPKLYVKEPSGLWLKYDRSSKSGLEFGFDPPPLPPLPPLPDPPEGAPNVAVKVTDVRFATPTFAVAD